LTKLDSSENYIHQVWSRERVPPVPVRWEIRFCAGSRIGCRYASITVRLCADGNATV